MSVEIVPSKRGALESFNYASRQNRIKRITNFLDLLLQLNCKDDIPGGDFADSVRTALVNTIKIMPGELKESYFRINHFEPDDCPTIDHLFPNKLPSDKSLFVYVGRLTIAEKDSYILAFSPRKKGYNVSILLLDNSPHNQAERENAIQLQHRNLRGFITIPNLEDVLEEVHSMFREEPVIVEVPKPTPEVQTSNNRVLFLANNPKFVPQPT